jgi:hypothetical protein
MYSSAFLNLGTTWKWVVSVKPRPLYPDEERTQSNSWTGGWTGRRNGLDAEENKFALFGTEPCISDRSPSLYRLSYLNQLFH